VSHATAERANECAQHRKRCPTLTPLADGYAALHTHTYASADGDEHPHSREELEPNGATGPTAPHDRHQADQVRRFYDAAVRDGLRQVNPALGEEELALLLRAVPQPPRGATADRVEGQRTEDGGAGEHPFGSQLRKAPYVIVPYVRKLRTAHERKALSQQNLAELAGVSKNTTHRLERGMSRAQPGGLRLTNLMPTN
jgi:DNA-binding XRE family transcriptional regulator